LLSQIEGGGAGIKRVPSYVAPDLAADIRRLVSSIIRQRKGSFPCFYVNEVATFALPAGQFPPLLSPHPSYNLLPYLQRLKICRSRCSSSFTRSFWTETHRRSWRTSRRRSTGHSRSRCGWAHGSLHCGTDRLAIACSTRPCRHAGVSSTGIIL
jgi:hypothetical protein